MSESQEPTRAQKLIGDFSPKMVCVFGSMTPLPSFREVAWAQTR
ncbi:MAG TPA: hypothetical protein VKR06_01315 [Ktedonosporobacter sp.]|nr:hypothetical protein [Ktedonosporobacter sp.]